MSNSSSDGLELIEAAAMVDMCTSAPPAVSRALGLQARHFGSAVAQMATHANVALFNRVVGLGLTEPVTEALLDDIMALYLPTGNMFMVQVVPHAQPATLSEWLMARGFLAHGNWTKLQRGPEPLPVTTDLRVEPVGPEYAEVFAEIVSLAYGIPPEEVALRLFMQSIVGRAGWQTFMAFDGARPIGTGALFVRDKVGWLGFAATLPEARRRGAQSALLARRIQTATALGCHRLVVEVTEDTPARPNPSSRNVQRAGFQIAYQRHNFIYPQ